MLDIPMAIPAMSRLSRPAAAKGRAQPGCSYAEAVPPAPPCELTTVLRALETVPGANAEIRPHGGGESIVATVDGLSARRVRDLLLAGDPPVAVLLIGDELLVHSKSLRADEVDPLATAFARVAADTHADHS
jgi:hypothetical protein